MVLPAPATALPKSQGRKRKRYLRQGFRSHYQFKNWYYVDGKREGAEPVRPLRRNNADLVNTCYLNLSTQTRTAYTIGFDIDAKRTQKKWLNAKGQVSWKLISDHLNEFYPEIAEFIFAVVRSTGNKGLAIFIAISPLELVEATAKAQNAARVLQQQIHTIFCHDGIGSDAAAFGLDRDFCNWHNPARTVFLKKSILANVQKERKRTAVVSHLLQELKRIPFIGYQKKRDQVGLIYHDARAEAKLAKLYLHMLEHFEQEGELSKALRQYEIRNISGLSEPFIRKLMKGELQLPWLRAKDCGDEGWDLCVSFTPDLTKRALELEKDGAEGQIRASIDLSESIIRPSDVRDGERNKWVTRVALKLKHAGVGKERTEELLEYWVKQIPGYRISRTCRNFLSIVKSIYLNKRKYFGFREESSVPSWLLHPGDKSYEQPKKSDSATVIKLQKGVVLPPTSRAEKTHPVCKEAVSSKGSSAARDSSILTTNAPGGARGGAASIKGPQTGTLIPLIRSFGKQTHPQKSQEEGFSSSQRAELQRIFLHKNLSKGQRNELLDLYLDANSKADPGLIEGVMDFARKLVPDLLKRKLKRDPSSEFRLVKGYFKMLVGFATPAQILALEYDFKKSEGLERVDFIKKLKHLALAAEEKRKTKELDQAKTKVQNKGHSKPSLSVLEYAQSLVDRQKTPK